MKIKLLSIFLIILLVITLTLFVLKKISSMAFWIIVIVAGLIAYKGIPWMRNRKDV